MINRVDIRIVVLIAFVLTIALRFVPHAYNVAPMGAFAILVGCYYSAPLAAILTMCAMAISDVLGHYFQIPSMGFYPSWMMLTVYGSLAASAAMGRLIRKRVNVATVPLAAIGGTIVFFVVTNFACWLDPVMGYERTLSGLSNCFAMAIPFARASLIGNLLYTSLAFAVYTQVVAPSLETAKAR